MAFKTLYKILCGGAKFDVNTAVNAGQFKDFCYSLIVPEEKQQLGDKIVIMEKAAQGETPYAGALDNPELAKFVDAMRKFKVA